ncbi:MAG: accessory gene regulator B family protein [Clostridia bacterium]|nr:accessory gene regulator B family protein [Clostridia bacterium]
MKIIQTCSYSCANYLTKQRSENHEKRRVYYFGFQVVIGAIIKGALLLSLALIFRTLIPTFTILLVFASLRVIAGGYHMDTYGKCIFVSLAFFQISAIVTQYTHLYWHKSYLILFIGINFIVGLPLILKWAPRDTPNKPITDPGEIKKFKTLSVVCFIAWFLVLITLWAFGNKILVLSGCFGIILELFAISALGHRFFDFISGRFDRVKK